MKTKKFSQDEVNRIVAIRIKRERERLAKGFESKMKRCLASLHLMFTQEMAAFKRDMAAEANDPFDPAIEPNTARPSLSRAEVPAEKNEQQGGERQ